MYARKNEYRKESVIVTAPSSIPEAILWQMVHCMLLLPVRRVQPATQSPSQIPGKGMLLPHWPKMKFLRLGPQSHFDRNNSAHHPFIGHTVNITMTMSATVTKTKTKMKFLRLRPR